MSDSNFNQYETSSNINNVTSPLSPFEIDDAVKLK